MVGSIKRDIINNNITQSNLVSIIIPHYNGEKILFECIDSLLQSTYKEVEIIVVNNASEDNSIRNINKYFPNVIILNCDKNYGYAEGCNKGAKIARGEYLIFLNNDTIQQADWIEPLVNKLNSNINISSIQPKIKNYNHRDRFDYAGGCGGEIDILGYPFTRGRIFNTIENDKGQYDTTTNIFWASGTAFITRKSIFNSVNGFDKILFAHMEEIDYHLKCHLMGYQVISEPNSIIYHKGGQTLGYHSPFKTYLNHRNSFLLLLSNFSFPLIVILFLPRFLLEILSGFYELLSGRINNFISIIKSMAWLILHPHIIIKRILFIRKIRKVKDTEILKLFYKGSIVLSYFILGKKTYNSL